MSFSLIGIDDGYYCFGFVGCNNRIMDMVLLMEAFVMLTAMVLICSVGVVTIAWLMYRYKPFSAFVELLCIGVGFVTICGFVGSGIGHFCYLAFKALS